MADAALRADGVSKRYGDRAALRDVTFAAGRGELLAIIGPNGAGKTTLLQIAAGALAPSAGVLLWVLGSLGIFPEGKTYAVGFGAWYGFAELIPYIGPAIGSAMNAPRKP